MHRHNCCPFPAAVLLGRAIFLYHALSAAAELLLCLFPSSDMLSLACSAGNDWCRSGGRLGAGTNPGQGGRLGHVGCLPGPRVNICRDTALAGSACAFTQGSACLGSKAPPGFSFTVLLFDSIQSLNRNSEHILTLKMSIFLLLKANPLGWFERGFFGVFLVVIFLLLVGWVCFFFLES